MGKLSIYLENKWLDHALKVSAFSVPGTKYLALSTTDFTEAGTGGTEPVGNGYNRVDISGNFATVAGSREISNDSQITCPTASGSWGTIGYWAIFDDVSGGNMLAYGAFSTPKAVGNGQTPKVATGQIVISVPTHTTYGMTSAFAHQMLDHTFLDGDAGYTPAAVYLALATGNLNDAGSMTNECAFTGSYARIQHQGGTNWDTTSNSATANKTAITSVVATGSWGTVSDWFLVTSATEDAGDMLLYGTFNSSSAVIADDQVNIPIGDLDITMS